MSDNQGSGLPRWGPSRAAATLVERRIHLVAADWQASCLDLEQDAEAMLRVIAEALHDCGGNTRAGHRHPSAGPRFEAARHLFEHLDAGSVTGLREVLRRQVLLDLGPQEALAALHCVSATLDELHERAGTWMAERLERLVYVDELTGLGNRRAAHESSHAYLATAVRHGRPLVAVVLDVDGLKRVNDSQGHEAGDEVLRCLADALRAGLREGDSAYRTGGDEFLVLLPETTRVDAEVVLGRVRDAGAPPFSFGTAQAPDEAMTVDDVVRLADQRLLDGRRQTRSGVSPPVAAPAAPEHRPLAGLAVRAAVLALALGAALAARTTLSGFDAADAAAVTGVGILVALLVAAAQSGRRSPAAITILAPLLGLAAASAMAPMLDAETRPSERIEHVAQPTTVSSPAPNGRAATVEVPTETIPPMPAWLSSTTTTTTTFVVPSLAPALSIATLVPLPTTTVPFFPTTLTTTTTTTTMTSTTPTTVAPYRGPPATTVGAAATTTTTTTTAKPTTTTASTTTTTASTTTTAKPTTTTATTTAKPTTTTGSTTRAVATDDEVVTPKRNLAVDVLANDQAPGGTLDPGTLSIVRQPPSGAATVRKNGTIHFKGLEDSPVRFQYQVCATNGTCARAWVTLTRERGRENAEER